LNYCVVNRTRTFLPYKVILYKSHFVDFRQ